MVVVKDVGMIVVWRLLIFTIWIQLKRTLVFHLRVILVAGKKFRQSWINALWCVLIVTEKFMLN
ncbi:MAG: hypothetical protein A3B70_06120 [Deltaproteobacteria bacterium RIFCSPHIGHO2_02_FULL_40_11]|nr:MAG: hypothetical protein A3B70_06120 [Deltaproteobacteria bacterium RIFCSPHIGHO2_02_FULL_40_11]